MMRESLKCAVVVLCVLVSETAPAQDVTLSMYMYLANHLTPQECLKLAAYLYAEGLELTAVKELEQDLPQDEPCLSLLSTWNNSAGKEKHFLSVADCLRKIGHEILAEWLSNAVFTQLSMELNNCFLQNTSLMDTFTTVPSRKIQPKFNDKSCSSDETILFLLCDTFCMYFILMSTVTLIFYSLGLLVRVVKERQNIQTIPKREYKILEIGNLPQDLDPEDNILDPLF